MRSSWLFATLILAGAAGTGPTLADDGTPAARPPNVVLIVADDLGYADVGFQGCTDIPTPHIDSIAEGGVRFTNGYVSCPVCSPTRAGLLTGRYQQRFGHEYNTGGTRGDFSGVGLPTDETTIADVLKAAGYVTGAVGKWHLGRDAEFHPQARGFDEFLGFLTGARSYFDHYSRKGAPLMRGREEIEEDDYLTDAFGREAAAFVERHHAKPFFLYLPFNAVHTPMHATPKYVDRFEGIRNHRRRTYAGMTSAMDDAVGRVLEALAKHGLVENTLVFFFSDNGGPTRKNGSINAPLREGKGTMYEGGVRVPFAVRWPAKLPAGTTYDGPVISLDVLATAAAAAGSPLPADHLTDGVDLVPYVRGAGAREGVPHETLFWRMGTRHALRHGDWKLVVERDAKPALYRLSGDAGEKTDLAAKHPEVLKDLQRRYAAWDAEMAQPRWQPPRRNRRR